MTRKDDKCTHLKQDLKSFFFYKFCLFVCFCFLAELGLRCYARAFSSCSERGLLFVAVSGVYSSLQCAGFSLR